MLIGFSPDEAAKPELYIRLVGLLAADQESIGLRELALETLKTLTGRDDLGYDPDKPEGKGFQAWAELLQKNQLHLPAPPPQGRATGTNKGKGARRRRGAIGLGLSHWADSTINKTLRRSLR